MLPKTGNTINMIYGIIVLSVLFLLLILFVQLLQALLEAAHQKKLSSLQERIQALLDKHRQASDY